MAVPTVDAVYDDAGFDAIGSGDQTKRSTRNPAPEQSRHSLALPPASAAGRAAPEGLPRGLIDDIRAARDTG